MDRILGASGIVGRQSRALGDTGEHARPDFLAIVEGENEIRPALTGKNAVRGSALTFDHPPEREQGGEDTAGFARRPETHAGTRNVSARSGTASPASMRSARMRSARDSARSTASFRLAPYARHPGNAGISAIHRPSSSWSISTSNLMRAHYTGNMGKQPERSGTGWPRGEGHAGERNQRCVRISSRGPSGPPIKADFQNLDDGSEGILPALFGILPNGFHLFCFSPAGMPERAGWKPTLPSQINTPSIGHSKTSRGA